MAKVGGKIWTWFLVLADTRLLAPVPTQLRYRTIHNDDGRKHMARVHKAKPLVCVDIVAFDDRPIFLVWSLCHRR